MRWRRMSVACRWRSRCRCMQHSEPRPSIRCICLTQSFGGELLNSVLPHLVSGKPSNTLVGCYAYTGISINMIHKCDRQTDRFAITYNNKCRSSLRWTAERGVVRSLEGLYDMATPMHKFRRNTHVANTETNDD